MRFVQFLTFLTRCWVIGVTLLIGVLFGCDNKISLYTNGLGFRNQPLLIKPKVDE